MSRPLRIEYRDACYYLMIRGWRGEEIFSGRRDYHYFVELLRGVEEMTEKLSKRQTQT